MTKKKADEPVDEAVDKPAAEAAAEPEKPAEPVGTAPAEAEAEPEKKRRVFVVTDEADIIAVAGKLGLPSHHELAWLNYGDRTPSTNNRYVTKGEVLVLPAQYDFAGVKGTRVAKKGDPQ
mgnify:CR=1 FL=1